MLVEFRGPIGELERNVRTNRRVGKNCEDQYYSWRQFWGDQLESWGELQGPIGELEIIAGTNRRVGKNCGDQ